MKYMQVTCLYKTTNLPLSNICLNAFRMTGWCWIAFLLLNIKYLKGNTIKKELHVIYTSWRFETMYCIIAHLNVVRFEWDLMREDMACHICTPATSRLYPNGVIHGSGHGRLLFDTELTFDDCLEKPVSSSRIMAFMVVFPQHCVCFFCQ